MTSAISKKKPPKIPAWVSEIGNALDHFHGYTWKADVIPNNYHFFVRNSAKQLCTPRAVSYNIHNRYELVIPLVGTGTVAIEDSFYQLAPGHSLLIQPHQFHHFVELDEELTWLFFSFELNPHSEIVTTNAPVHEFTDEEDMLLQQAGRLRVNPLLKEYDNFEIAYRMASILRKMKDRAHISPLNGYNETNAKKTEMLRTVARYVYTKLDQGIGIQDLANLLRMSESNLRKRFRESYDVSLGNYLRRSKTIKGLQLIGNTDLNLSTIANMCGFETIHSFSQAFKKILGMSPSSYRKHLLEGGMPIILHNRIR